MLCRFCPRSSLSFTFNQNLPFVLRLLSTDRLHSTDIAFKPTEDGWGFTKKYSKGYDSIFSKSKGAELKTPPDFVLLNQTLDTIGRMDEATRNALVSKLKEKFGLK